MSSSDSGMLTARICVIVLLPGITFILGMLPLWLTKYLKWDKHQIASLQGHKAQFIFSKLLCFAGGVLLATSFMHLLPDLQILCAEQVEIGHLPDWGLKLPWAEFFVMCGFFLVYLIEELAHAFVHWQSKAQHPEPVQPFAASPCIEEIQQNVTGIPRVVVEKETRKEALDHDDGLPVKHQHANGHGHGHGGHGHSHAPTVNSNDSVMANVRNILTVMALSFHCVFEGIAVGMEDSAIEVWYLFGAIASHKFVIAFCVGVELLVSGTKTLFIYIYVFIFGFVSLIGVAIGFALASSGADGSDKSVATVVMQGMAAGTIVYVTFFEVLQREKANKENNQGFLQLMAVVTGFVAMVGFMAIAPSPGSYIPPSESF